MDLIQASARNQAAWADKQIRAHGIECRYSDVLWTCWGSGVATEIHDEAVAIAPRSSEHDTRIVDEIEQLVAAHGNELVVMDWWSELDLTHLGFELVRNTGVEPSPYLYRPPGGEPTIDPPPELEIERVTNSEELQEFEEATFHGYEKSGEYRPFSWYAPASLNDPDMIYLSGRVNGQVVSVSIAVISDGIVGIFGVATKPDYRRRGYGRAITWAAIQTAPTLPAVLGPSDDGEPLYRAMGFRDFHTFRVWRRPKPG